MLNLETPRLTLRNFRPEKDGNPLREMIVQYMSSPYGKYDHTWPTSEEGIQGACDWFASGDQYLAVCLKESGRFIGYVCLNPTDEQGVYNIGYCFDFREHGKGYALESCRALVAYAFQELKAAKIITGTAAANEPSCKLLNRLGMRPVRESTGSFSNDADGNPIVFAGYEFELTREAWDGYINAT